LEETTEIIQNNPGDMDIVALGGRLDDCTSAKLLEALNSLMETGRVRLIINCENLEYISDEGLTAFSEALKKAKDLGGNIKLVCTDPEMKTSINAEEVTQALTIYACDEDAIKSYLWDYTPPDLSM
jgi:anti-anti-sigma factor